MVWQVIAQQNRYGNVTKLNKFHGKMLVFCGKQAFFYKNSIVYLVKEQFHNQKAEKEAHKSGISRQNAKKNA